MKTRIVTTFLILPLALSLAAPTMAHEAPEAPPNFDGNEATFQEYINSISNSYTITFDESDQSQDILYSNVSAQSTSNDTETYNEKAAKKATDFVKSLNLSEKGYQEIETFCLEELASYAKMEDATLVSYTVHVPKETSVQAAKPPAGYFFFGSYGGRDFYFYYPSTGTIKTNIKKESTKSTLQKWVSGSVNLLMSYASIKVSVPWTIFQTILGTPSGYTIKNGAHVDHYCNVNIHTRGIYTLYGNGKYSMVTSQQFGDVYPYAVFHPCDSPKYAGSYNKDFGYKGQVFSPKYKQSTQNLSKEAWQVFNGAVGIGKHDKINTQSYSGFFK